MAPPNREQTTVPTVQARRGWMPILAVLVAIGITTISALALITVPTASAETPAERCARETAAYNSAWAQSWAASNGKPASQAPPPPVPYTCVDPGPPTSSTTPPSSVTAPTIPTETNTPDTGGPNVGAHAPTDIPEAGQTPIVPTPRASVPSEGARLPGQPGDVDQPTSAPEVPRLRDAPSLRHPASSGYYQSNCEQAGAKLVEGAYEGAFSTVREGSCVLEIDGGVKPDRSGKSAGCTVTSPTQGCTASISDTVTTTWSGNVGLSKTVTASAGYSVAEGQIVNSGCTFQPGAPAGTVHRAYPMVRNRLFLVWDASWSRKPGQWDGVEQVTAREPTGEVYCETNGGN
nr:hypothetical protein [Gordonia sp. LAM0048]